MKAREDAATGIRVAGGSRRRLTPDIVSIFLVYLISGIGLLAIGGSFLASAAPDLSSTGPLFLLGVLPLATLVILFIQARDLLRSLAKKRYGSRLRIKMAMLFIGLVLISTIPQGIFAIRLVALAGERLHSSETARGIKEGLALLLEYHNEDAARLETLAQSELPPLLGATRDPARLLAQLQAVEPRLEALEIFGPGKSKTGAGPAAARLNAPPSAGITGSLPAETREGVSRLRYAEAWGQAVIVLCLRLPDGFETATGAMASADRELSAANAAAPNWILFVLLTYGLFVLPLLLLAILLGMAAADFIVEPLGGLEDATKRIASGDFAIRLLVKSGDERGWLIASFNRMLDAMERWREGDLIQERIDAWKDIAQRLAHELKNPLTPIRLASERLLRTAQNDPARALELLEDSMLAVIAEVDSMDSLLGDFRAFASLPTPQMDWVALADLVEDSIAMYRASYPEVVFTLDSLPAEVRLHVDRSMIKRALGNLLANAIEAMNGKGRIGIGADLVKTGDSSYCRLRIGDSGRGIAREDRDRVFMPYFTTKETGTGLGLAIVERIVHDHGGRIRFESAEGVGTVFWIDLPVER
jgi:nitrogen fixation/metabolism regulation signal transduction histidine kinase